MKLGYGLVLPFFVATLCAGAAACSDASGGSSGGDQRFDASTPPAPDAGASDGSMADGPAPPSCAKDGGATWTDLYNDCFGPMEAACGTGTCHDNSSSTGGHVWVCGATKDTCYVGIQSVIDNTDPTMTTLYGALRKSPGCASCMPRNSNFTFEPDDLMRITTWIANGAKND